MGELQCFNCDQGNTMKYTEMYSCYCHKALNVKRHILLETVTYEQWDLIMDIADREHIYIYVHDLCSLPFVTKYSSKIFVYIPGTDRCTVETIEHQSELISLAGMEIQVRKPIITNAMASVQSLWTRRFIQRRVITYHQKTVTTTDDTLKYVSSVIAGAKFSKPEHIIDQVARVEKDI
jgi:hypothetical protein